MASAAGPRARGSDVCAPQDDEQVRGKHSPGVACEVGGAGCGGGGGRHWRQCNKNPEVSSQNPEETRRSRGILDSEFSCSEFWLLDSSRSVRISCLAAMHSF